MHLKPSNVHVEQEECIIYGALHIITAQNGRKAERASERTIDVADGVREADLLCGLFICKDYVVCSLFINPSGGDNQQPTTFSSKTIHNNF